MATHSIAAAVGQLAITSALHSPYQLYSPACMQQEPGCCRQHVWVPAVAQLALVRAEVCS